MGERYRTVYFAIVGLTSLWFIIILLCLPQSANEIEHHWQTATSSKLVIDSPPLVGDRDDFDDFIGRRYESNLQVQPKSQKEKDLGDDILLYRHTKEGFSTVDTLFFGLDFNSKVSLVGDSREAATTNESSISKELHDKLTLKLGSIDSPIEQYVETEGYKLFAFNLLVSNRIGIFRLIPDTRNKKCHHHVASQAGTFNHDTLNKISSAPSTSTKTSINSNELNQSGINLKASIIICYYNEAPSALLRTIYTILKRSSLLLIQEIIVLDDFSSPEYHYSKISPFISSKLVSFKRTSKREGLIRARLFGARLAKGDVLIFLDSHVEANVGWLEPLLKTIQQNRSTIACPMIDLINSDTLIYSASPLVKGGLNWALNFKWDSVPSENLKTYDDFIKPIESPTLAGGLYAIDREYFHKLGEYDSGMELWGGENVELSLRTWMCGGRIVILPCSRLGHIFRKRRPYGPEPGQKDSLLVNSHRTARVWLGDYIYKFYEANPDAKYLVSGDVSQRIELKYKLGCQNFSWFIENVYPKLGTELKTDAIQNGSKFTPKSMDLFQKRIGRSSSRWRGNQVPSLANNLRLQRQASHNLTPLNRKHNLEIIDAEKVERSFDFIQIDSPHNHLPKMISQFQIQSARSNLCVESKGGFIAKGFTRLVLNHCAEVNRNNNGEISINNSAIFNQLWTETEIHDYRLGDSQCLDLIKNLPLLRKCHSMGSFQNWTYDTQMINDTNIYSSGGVLCLGVERVQVGEPIIVTICDRQISGLEDSSGKVSKKLSRRSRHPDKAFINRRGVGWPSFSPTHPLTTKRFRDTRLEPLRPSQRWSIIFVNNSLSLATRGSNT